MCAGVHVGPVRVEEVGKVKGISAQHLAVGFDGGPGRDALGSIREAVAYGSHDLDARGEVHYDALNAFFLFFTISFLPLFRPFLGGKEDRGDALRVLCHGSSTFEKKGWKHSPLLEGRWWEHKR